MKDVDLILVPQGAEYRAVCRGLGKNSIQPKIVPIPMGVNSLDAYLERQRWAGKKIVLLGLAGSLSPQHRVGDVVVYQSCLYLRDKSPLPCQDCHPQLTHYLQQRLNATLVQGLTCDRLIVGAREKLALGSTYGATVVDMEGYALLERYSSAAMVRVIGDSCDRDLPDLNWAISATGSLDYGRVAIAFLRQPLGAITLIGGSLRGLKILARVAKKLG